MPISRAARRWTPPVARSASIMRRRSRARSSSATGRKLSAVRTSSTSVSTGSAGGSAVSDARPSTTVSGRCHGSTRSPSASAAAYAMACLSSRTFPSHGCASSRCSAAGPIVIASRWTLAHAAARKCCASTAISLRRARSGGSATPAPLSRKYRSLRNRSAATSAARSRLVAATIRMSSARSCRPPSRVTRWSSSTRSSLDCAVGDSALTSSRNSVPPSARSSSPALPVTAPRNAPRS